MGNECLKETEDYVERAERVMRDKRLTYADRKDPKKLRFYLTTSKIRNILSLANEIYNEERIRKDAALSDAAREKIQMMRVRILYEAGREPAVKTFVEVSGILEELKKIGSSRKKFIAFSRYLEALVAYHRFLGGE